MPNAILFVDDDANVLTGYQRSLGKQFDVDLALGPDDGIKKFTSFGPYSVVVSDMHMPGMDGIEFLARIREINSDTVRMMLTGHADLHVAMDAINRGNIFRFLMKPCQPSDLAAALQDGIGQYQLVMAERELLDKTLTACVQALVDLLAMFDDEGFGKTLALRDLVRDLARGMNIEKSWSLEMAAMLSYIGHITLPPEILVKTRKGQALSEQENALMRRVPEIGHNILKNIPRLEPVAQAILYQAKNYDGTGYPDDSVAERSIPIGSRILRILADFNEMTLAGKSPQEACALLSEKTGCYDPRILEKIKACFADMALANNADDRRSPVAISLTYVRNLPVGSVLAGDVHAKDGRLLISAGHRITEVFLAKIQNYHETVGVVEPIRILA